MSMSYFSTGRVQAENENRNSTGNENEGEGQGQKRKQLQSPRQIRPGCSSFEGEGESGSDSDSEAKVPRASVIASSNQAQAPIIDLVSGSASTFYKKQKVCQPSWFDGTGKGKPKLYEIACELSKFHKSYAYDHPTGGGIFGTAHIVEQKGKNYRMICLGCSFVRTGSIGLIVDHLKECPLSAVPVNERAGHREYLDREIRLFNSAYRKDVQTATAKRELINPEVQTIFRDSASKQLALLQSVARASLGCNWSMLQAENPHFRQMCFEISKMQLSKTDLAVLGRKAVVDDMDRQAGDIQTTSKAKWTKTATSYGGSFTADGWTAARNFGMIGLALFSLGVVHYENLIHSGRSSTADDYLQKIVPVLPLALIYFMCTDGASNMIKFGRLMTEQHHVLPQLCSAHGFSLVNHYIGSCFEGEFGFVKRISGIVAFFNRSPQRMQVLRETSGQSLGFVKVAKTRFAYMTFVFLRVLRLRSFAQIAMTKLVPPKGKDEDDVDVDSKHMKVKDALNDNTLFEEVELFIRVTFPVVLIMREFDRGLPMTGFVFWAFYCVESQVKRILDALVEKDPSKEPLRTKIMQSIAWMWEKRHTPMLSFAYLTNPLFHATITEGGCKPYDLASHFSSDVKLVLRAMIRKRYPDWTDNQRMTELSSAVAALDKYFDTPLDDLQREASKHMLASQWWGGMNGSDYSPLAYYASRVHAAPCVSSSLERFFSMMTNVQTTTRASLGAERAALYAAAHNDMVSSAAEREVDEVNRKSTTVSVLGDQERIVEFVLRLEEIIDSEQLPSVEAEGMRDVEAWLESVAQSGASLIYREPPASSQVPSGPTIRSDTEPETESTSLPEVAPSVLEELDENVHEREGKVSRIRRAPKRYIETCN